jgi:class 3 adenylate cyclase/tetratricopeptide (TPR) repeat protein
MPDRPEAAITTLLFTDLVNSTELIGRIGDEQAQWIFEAHHGTLVDCLGAHGGEELQWEGDGLMAAFASAGDAVRCAVAMQRAVLQPVLGHRLELRAGLNAGEILRQEIGSGHFGTPVVVASRLCDRAEAGQILASSLVAGLLAGRQAFHFRDLGPAELKGIEAPVGVAEVVYEVKRASPFAGKTPFVGRTEELARLADALERAAAGSGGLVLAVGEPGIGKTRVLEEFAARVGSLGTRVLWGRCYEGEGARPYAPFAEALEEYLRRSDPEELRKDLGPYGVAIEAMAPTLRVQLPDLAELPKLKPDEERTRLFDALTQLLLATAQRAPVLFVLDDLHWADRGTIALLRYVARFARKGRLLLLGAYRDVELDRQHPLAEALAALKREVEYERISLKGLAPTQVGELLEAIAAHEVPAAFAEAMSAETEGNPFFIREILLHLVEEGMLTWAEGYWTSEVSIEELGIPEGVRQVIGRRLSRLSGEANRLLAAASGCDGAFEFPVVVEVGELDEKTGLDALDEALDAALLRPAGDAQTYDFTHALVRHTLYVELNPARQVRLHRRLAEAMERVHGEGAAEHAGEIARQYHRSAVLPGAERGVPYALEAADRADRAAAHEEVASFMRLPLDLLPKDDSRRPHLLARLGLALARSLAAEEAVQVGTEAGERLAEAEGSDAAADYLAELCGAVHHEPLAWPLVEQGLRHIGGRRDLAWARLARLDQHRREATAPNFPGIPLDTPVRREITRVVLQEPHSWWSPENLAIASRRDVLEQCSDHWYSIVYLAGEFRRGLSLWFEELEQLLSRGAVASAANMLTHLSRLHSALGNVSAAAECVDRASALAERVTGAALPANLGSTRADLAFTRGESFEPLLPVGEAVVEENLPELRFARAVTCAYLACGYAHAGRDTDARKSLEAAIPGIERAPGWSQNYTMMIHRAIETIWTLDRKDHAELLERNLREKTLVPDFRYPHTDARLSLARLCALGARFDEAAEWFAKARTVLDEQGARPLRAITDYDEALMYVRRGAPGDRERAESLLNLALPPFREIGMPGWTRRAEALLGEKAPTA